MNNKTLPELLDEKIPRDVVSLRDGGGGRKLSYLEGWYVIDRLNKIFGHTRWSKEITDVRQVVNTTQRGEFPAYLAKVRLTVMDESGVSVVKEAYGYGADKSSQNAHELAIKEAVTDALKVAAKDLGMSLGLALYDKEQTNVDDGEDSKPAPQKEDMGQAPVEGNAKKAETGQGDKLRQYIQTATKLAIKKGAALDVIKKELAGRFGVTSLSDADDSQLTEIKKYIDSLI